jgi:hypothetical protein
MITYERQEATSPEFPRDVKLITDDSDAEMAQLQEMIAECEFDAIELPKEPDADGKFSFIIPGAAVGEFSEFVWDIDNGQLEGLTEQWNAEMISAMDDDA